MAILNKIGPVHIAWHSCELDADQAGPSNSQVLQEQPDKRVMEPD